MDCFHENVVARKVVTYLVLEWNRKKDLIIVDKQKQELKKQLMIKGCVVLDVGKSYDLPTLLRFGDLDIRGIAAKNETLSVTEYFNILTKFLTESPIVMDDLDRIIKLASDDKAFKNLADMKSLLISIGCARLTPVVDSILDAGEKGNKEVAAICAEKISTDFADLYSRTRTAENARIKSSNKDASVPEDEENSELSLKTFVEQLDYEEANRKLRILAVDDASFMLSTISSILKNDYEIFSLTKGALVEKFLRHTTPELFLLDYTMPEINGFELVPIIRSFEEHKDTPIVFLTAMGTVHHITTAISLGACDFIVKPVNPALLREKIAKHIVRKKAF